MGLIACHIQSPSTKGDDPNILKLVYVDSEYTVAVIFKRNTEETKLFTYIIVM